MTWGLVQKDSTLNTLTQALAAVHASYPVTERLSRYGIRQTFLSPDEQNKLSNRIGAYTSDPEMAYGYCLRMCSIFEVPRAVKRSAGNTLQARAYLHAASERIVRFSEKDPDTLKEYEKTSLTEIYENLVRRALSPKHSEMMMTVARQILLDQWWREDECILPDTISELILFMSREWYEEELEYQMKLHPVSLEAGEYYVIFLKLARELGLWLWNFWENVFLQISSSTTPPNIANGSKDMQIHTVIQKTLALITAETLPEKIDEVVTLFMQKLTEYQNLYSAISQYIHTSSYAHIEDIRKRCNTIEFMLWEYFDSATNPLKRSRITTKDMALSLEQVHRRILALWLLVDFRDTNPQEKNTSRLIT